MSTLGNRAEKPKNAVNNFDILDFSVEKETSIKNLHLPLQLFKMFKITYSPSDHLLSHEIKLIIINFL